jgi:hypothetical protein
MTPCNLKLLPGATVLYDGGQFEIADPFRRPSALLATVLHLLVTKRQVQYIYFKE